MVRFVVLQFGKFTLIEVEFGKPTATKVPDTAKFDELMQACGVRSRDALISEALNFLGWGVRKRKEGRIICSADKDWENIVQLDLPVLNAVKPPIIKTKTSFFRMPST